MSTREFKHITQNRSYRFNAAESGCGIACAAMIGRIKFEDALSHHINSKGLNFDEINEILKMCGASVFIKNSFEGKNRNEKTNRREKGLHVSRCKTENSCFDIFTSRTKKLGLSLLVEVLYEPENEGWLRHWVLYDCQSEKIHDPLNAKECSIKNFINEYYSKTKSFRFHLIQPI